VGLLSEAVCTANPLKLSFNPHEEQARPDGERDGISPSSRGKNIDICGRQANHYQKVEGLVSGDIPSKVRQKSFYDTKQILGNKNRSQAMLDQPLAGERGGERKKG